MRSTFLSYWIAYRFWKSKKSYSLINILTYVTFFGIMIAVAALIIVICVFNGFEDVIVSMTEVIYPDISITKADGKPFDKDSLNLDKIKQIPGISFIEPTIEATALARYDDEQIVVKVKGISTDGYNVQNITPYIIYGESQVIIFDSIPAVILGSGVAHNLNVNINDYSRYLYLYSIKENSSQISATALFTESACAVSGIFAINQDYDNVYIYAPISEVQNLLDIGNNYSNIEINIAKGANLTKVKRELTKLVPEGFIVKDRQQQDELLYKILRNERLIVFILLAFIVLIASLNVISSLGLLLLDKQKRVQTLYALGMDISQLKKLFLREGAIVVLGGGLIGLLLGSVIAFLQLQFGIVPMQGGEMVGYLAYPIAFNFIDYFFIILLLIIISILLPRLTVKRIDKNFVTIRNN
ncbi:MAG: ABC transporter permease [Bacteroidales bacterium]|nr:ABC transporter permease [Bacteroidales bacterium]MDI3545899.1 lipoprotein-releasing system permease protein [Rikenellaceae bacterium]